MTSDASSRHSDPRDFSRLSCMLDAVAAYMHHVDPTHFAVVAATAATAELDGDPLWLMLVAPPSSGKTEAIRALDSVTDQHIDDVTHAGLLTFTKGKVPKPTGALTRLPARGLMTFGDLSTLLAGSDRGGREETFAALRRIYDGHYTRTMATGPLVWRGRVTVAAAVTGLIDNYSSHETALGDRWIKWRLPTKSYDEIREAQRAARRDNVGERRSKLAEAMHELVVHARQKAAHVVIEDRLALAVEDAAMVAAQGRTPVPRHGYGRREIDGIPEPEEPHRLTEQMRTLAVGLVAIGYDEASAAAVCRRAALSTLPEARRRLLNVLALRGRQTTSEAARRASMSRKPARMRLEDMEAVGFVRSDRAGREPLPGEPDRRVAWWELDGPVGELIKQVVRRDACGWEAVRSYGVTPPA